MCIIMLILVLTGVYSENSTWWLCVCVDQNDVPTLWSTHTQTFYTHSSTHTQKETLVLKQRLFWWTVKSLSEMRRGNHPRFAECGWTKLFKLLSAVGRLDSSFLICSHSSSLSCSLALSLSQLKSLNFILNWRFAVVGIKHRNLFLIYLFV